MRRKRSSIRSKGEAAELEMTPMIDVVFQLLIFFLVTLKPEDILSRLDVSRPAPDSQAKEEDISDLLTVTVHKDGYMLKGTPTSWARLERNLGRMAAISRNVSVIIRCTGTSEHDNLVQLLDLCAKLGLTKLSVFSM